MRSSMSKHDVELPHKIHYTNAYNAMNHNSFKSKSRDALAMLLQHAHVLMVAHIVHYRPS